MDTHGFACILSLAYCLIGITAPVHAGSGKTLQPFANDVEFAQWLRAWRKQNRTEKRIASASPPAPAAMSLPIETGSTALDRIEVTGSRISLADVASITNVQTLGVDEGDIVKRSGDFLLVLRRGRIFSIRIGDDRLQPVSAIDAYAPNANPDNTWYDEMLVADGKIVVIGYSYERGGTELGLFDLDAHGKLHYRSTYQMRTNDYYSDRNYASHLIGHQLVFYSPLSIDLHGDDIDGFIPALRHWRLGATPRDFKRILPANRIYRASVDAEQDEDLALHSVSLCDLDAAEMQCRSTAVLGPEGRVFYVSQDSVYVWTTPWSHDQAKPNASAVFRIPLDGGPPTGIGASGSPIDQMSFLQQDEVLNVLVGSEADGEGMWASGSKAGELALLRIPLDSLGDGSDVVTPAAYRQLPGIDFNNYGIQNRYVGNWLLYGAGERWGRGSNLRIAHAVPFKVTAPVETIRLGHLVERIDALRDHAVVIGSNDEDLHFTTLRLDDHATPVSQYVQPDAQQGDDRTHGFFYKPQIREEGILGLPTVRYNQDGDDSDGANVLYLRNRDLRLSRMGTLDSGAQRRGDDDCKVSCVDWYGNARPIFIGDRIFALLGYELVEGRIRNGVIEERRRADFSRLKYAE